MSQDLASVPSLHTLRESDCNGSTASNVPGSRCSAGIHVKPRALKLGRSEKTEEELVVFNTTSQSWLVKIKISSLGKYKISSSGGVLPSKMRMAFNVGLAPKIKTLGGSTSDFVINDKLQIMATELTDEEGVKYAEGITLHEMKNIWQDSRSGARRTIKKVVPITEYFDGSSKYETTVESDIKEDVLGGSLSLKSVGDEGTTEESSAWRLDLNGDKRGGSVPANLVPSLKEEGKKKKKEEECTAPLIPPSNELTSLKTSFERLKANSGDKQRALEQKLESLEEKAASMQQTLSTLSIAVADLGKRVQSGQGRTGQKSKTVPGLILDAAALAVAFAALLCCLVLTKNSRAVKAL